MLAVMRLKYADRSVYVSDSEIPDLLWASKVHNYVLKRLKLNLIQCELNPVSIVTTHFLYDNFNRLLSSYLCLNQPLTFPLKCPYNSVVFIY